MSTTTLTNNATIVASLYEAFGRGDIAVILDHLADDCVWVSPGEGALPQGGTYIGKEAGIFFQKLAEHETFEVFDVLSINAINDREVVAMGHAQVTVNTTGKKVDTNWIMHWKFNNQGKVVYFEDFFDSAQTYLAYQR